MFKTVLFPIDMSPEAQQAAAVAVKMVKTFDSRLILLSVIETTEDESSAAHPGQTSPDVVANLLTKAQSLFSEQGIESEVMERQGQPAFVICDVADEIGADLIVMGCRGLGLIEDSRADSVSNRVINLAPCPVLVVP
ncbi:MAG: universal stress protein [Leptolyngbyaceae cyanobacterium MO_188.B28]|nr:universal stress protein [Leptolyngbyaceae cyanobacterium MO_188.B28]